MCSYVISCLNLCLNHHDYVSVFFVIDECLSVWVVSMNNDEIGCWITDEVAMDCGEIGVVYVDDYANMIQY